MLITLSFMFWHPDKSVIKNASGEFVESPPTAFKKRVTKRALFNAGQQTGIW